MLRRGGRRKSKSKPESAEGVGQLEAVGRFSDLALGVANASLLDDLHYVRWPPPQIGGGLAIAGAPHGAVRFDLVTLLVSRRPMFRARRFLASDGSRPAGSCFRRAPKRPYSHLVDHSQ